jgi:hypothetical protein
MKSPAKSPAKSPGEKWNEFWFEPSTADNLGLARILIYGSMSIFYLVTPALFPSWGWHVNFSEWGGVSKVFWHPLWIFHVLHLPLLSVQTIAILQYALIASMVFAALGLFTKPATIASFLLGFYLFGLPNNFGKVHHLETPLLWAFLIMAVSRCGDAFSLDALVRPRKSDSQPVVSGDYAVVSGDYTWPIKLFWCVLALIYFEAGISKLRHSGIAWVTSGLMSFYLQRAQYHITDAEPLTNWGLFIARHPILSHVSSGYALLLELAYPLAIFSRRARRIIPWGGIAMQTGIALLMGPNFWQLIICQLLWFPLDKIYYSIVPRKSRGVFVPLATTLHGA